MPALLGDHKGRPYLRHTLPRVRNSREGSARPYRGSHFTASKAMRRVR